MRALSFTILLAAGGCGAGGGPAAPDATPAPDAPSANDEAWRDTLAEVSTRLGDLGIAGAGVAVVLDGHLAYSGGVGVRSRATGAPVTASTLFRTSSAGSKPAMAMTLLSLAEDGVIDLHAPIGSLAPDVQLDPAYAAAIDLDVALIQRSGIPGLSLRSSCTPTNADVLRYFQGLGTIASTAEPGAVWQYSAIGAVGGAAVVETVEGAPFPQVVSDRVLEPAGMTTATYDLAAAAAADHAVGYDGATPLEPTHAGFDCGDRMANTGLYASADDLGHFVEALLAPGRVLSAASLATLEGVDHNPGWGDGWSYGYQAYGLLYKGVRVFHHYGASEGQNGGLSWIPERGFGVVLLTNGDEGANVVNVYALEELRWWIIDRFLGLAGAPPDFTTSPSTWGPYEGTYTSPGATFTVALDATDQLTIAIDPQHPSPIALVQGAIDVPYEGGDLFNHVDSTNLMLVQFYPGYAGIYSTRFGGFVAVRVTPGAGAGSSAAASAHRGTGPRDTSPAAAAAWAP